MVVVVALFVGAGPDAIYSQPVLTAYVGLPVFLGRFRFADEYVDFWVTLPPNRDLLRKSRLG
jgi:hypothetical protein